MPAQVTPDLRSQAKEKCKSSPNGIVNFLEWSEWHTAKSQIHFRYVRKKEFVLSSREQKMSLLALQGAVLGWMRDLVLILAQFRESQCLGAHEKKTPPP